MMGQILALGIVVAGLLYVVGARPLGGRVLVLSVLLALVGSLITPALRAVFDGLGQHLGAVLGLVLLLVVARAYLHLKAERRRLGRLLGEHHTSLKRRIERE